MATGQDGDNAHSARSASDPSNRWTNGDRIRALDTVQAASLDRGPATFLARQTYLRRRLMDAARMLPAFGTALFLLPTIWISVDSPAETSSGFVYLFAVWFLLILVGLVIARRIMAPLPQVAPGDVSSIRARSDIDANGLAASERVDARAE